MAAAPSLRLTEDVSSGTNRRTKKLLVGALSGVLSALAFQPLDVLRTHQQGAFGSVNTNTSHAPQSQQQLLMRVRGMWRGTSSTLLRVAGGAGLYFTTLDHCLQILPHSDINTFFSGAFARTFAGSVMSPLTIVKARMEWQAPGTYSSNWQVLQHVLRQEGVRGLYRGMIPTLIRDVPFSGLYVLLYTRLKAMMEFEFPHTPTYGVHFSSGVAAGILATTIVHPADVVKTRMQLAVVGRDASGKVQMLTNSLTLRQTVEKILTGEGWRGFTKGIVPRVLKRTLSTAVTWTIYEQLSLR